MAKRKQTTQWQTTERVKLFPAAYYVMIGQRGNGKTYSVKKEIIDRVKKGDKFFYLRRKHTHITRSKMAEYFENVSQYAIKELGDYIKYSTDKGFYINVENEDVNVGYVGSIEDSFDLKGLDFEKVKIIFFDEFMDYTYFQDEIRRFMHIISTIVRDRKDVDIFLAGNTISQESPYLKLFGVDMKKLHQGDLKHIIHQRGATITIEYCAEKVDEIGGFKTHKYLGFDNDMTANMILFGEWEYKTTNIKNIDGIGWSSQRRMIPLYISYMENVYELSLSKTQIPVAFVRQINTQDGKVRQNIKYHITYDRTLSLSTKQNIVPSFTNISYFIDTNTKEDMKIFIECMKSTRVVYDSYKTGTEFSVAFKEILKNTPS